MNPIKQEPWDAGSDFHWNTSSSLPQSPYFNPEIHGTQIKIEPDDYTHLHSSSGPPSSALKEPKKRGRPKKAKGESGMSEADLKQEKKMKQEMITSHLPVTKKRKDRFNGMPEEEVLQRLLPDHLAPNLDILIIGINPGLFAAYVGHHYAGPGNHFWRCMFLSGLIPEPMSAYDDYKLLTFGIGFTNICARTTRGSSDLKKQEIKDGAEILRKKLVTYKPKIAVFNGKGIFEVFSGNKNFNIGKQSEKIEGTDTVLFVMPSSSARCAQLPRATDKVPFYLALKKLRDFIKGDLTTLDESECIFPGLEAKSKPEAKDEDSDGDEDSRLSSGDFSTKEMTLDQIQNQSEYLEALIASAEGKEIPTARGRIRNKMNKKTNCVDMETCAEEVPQFHQLKPRIGSQITKILQSSLHGGQTVLGLDIKQEMTYDTNEYESLAVNGPAAQKVSVDSDSDPYQTPASALTQYMSLGGIPNKNPSDTPFNKSNIISQRSPEQPQKSLTNTNQSPLTQSKVLHSAQETRVISQNGARFPHSQSQASITSSVDAKPANFLNI